MAAAMAWVGSGAGMMPSCRPATDLTMTAWLHCFSRARCMQCSNLKLKMKLVSLSGEAAFSEDWLEDQLVMQPEIVGLVKVSVIGPLH